MRIETSNGQIITSQDSSGETATVLPVSVLYPGAVSRATFLNNTEGWIVYSAGTCAKFKADCSQETELLSTVDGGKSFAVVTPVLSATGNETAIPNSSEVSVDEGFDMACVSTWPNMDTWWQYSPYYDTGVYLGGDNVGCKANTYLNSEWVSLVSNMGWGIIPIWVGLQAPCIGNSSNFWTIAENSPLNSPYQEGENDATAAVAMANSLGMSSTVIYFDMEYYVPQSACSTAVISFLQGWATQLHTDGYLAGLYGSLGDWWTTAGASDFIQLSPLMDDVWIANWDGNDSVWNIGALPNTYWPNNQRIHQYENEPSETWGGVKFGGPPNSGIDRDVEDAPVYSWGGDRDLPAPTLESPANSASQVTTTPTFTWTAVGGAVNGYRIMVATQQSYLPTSAADSSCPNCTINYPPSGQTLLTTSYTPPASTLQAGVSYWWQVQVIPQSPKLGDWSSQSNFQTGTLATAVQSISIDPSTLAVASNAVVRVFLNGLAPSTGTSVGLTSSNKTVLPLPANVQVQPGQSVASVNLVAGNVIKNTNVTLKAMYNGTQQTTATVVPSTSTVTTSAAGSPGVATAILNGSVNPQNASGTAGFEWGTDSTMGTYTVACPYGYIAYCPPVNPNTTTQPFALTVTDLSSTTNYYYRMVFYNSTTGASQYGTVQSFETISPVVTTTAAGSITGSGGALNGTVNPQNAHGTAGLEWGTDPTWTVYTVACPFGYVGYCAPVNPNTSTQSFSYTLTGLPAAVTYYFRMVFYDTDNNSYYYGGTQSFTTGNPAVLSIVKPSSITASGGILNATINPEGAHGNAGFEWGTDPTMGTYTTACTFGYLGYCAPVIPNSTTQSFSFTLTGLASTTPYYYRLAFYDTDNNSYEYSPIWILTTLTPAVNTLSASSVTSSAAILGGTVNPEGANGTAGFEWGTDPVLNTYNIACPYGSYSFCTPVIANLSPQTFTGVLTGLNPSTIYYYRMVFWDTDNNTSQNGTIGSFTTTSAKH